MPRSNRLGFPGCCDDWVGGKSSTRIATLWIRLRNSWGSESKACSATLTKSLRFILHHSYQGRAHSELPSLASHRHRRRRRRLHLPCLLRVWRVSTMTPINGSRHSQAQAQKGDKAGPRNPDALRVQILLSRGVALKHDWNRLLCLNEPLPRRRYECRRCNRKCLELLTV